MRRFLDIVVALTFLAFFTFLGVQIVQAIRHPEPYPEHAAESDRPVGELRSVRRLSDVGRNWQTADFPPVTDVELLPCPQGFKGIAAESIWVGGESRPVSSVLVAPVVVGAAVFAPGFAPTYQPPDHVEQLKTMPFRCIVTQDWDRDGNLTHHSIGGPAVHPKLLPGEIPASYDVLRGKYTGGKRFN